MVSDEEKALSRAIEIEELAIAHSRALGVSKLVRQPEAPKATH